jgi:hypothetical protein
MVEVSTLSLQITQTYQEFMASLHPWFQTFINIALIAILVTLFLAFIWKIYHIIAKKNLLELNLKKYNTASHPFFEKFLGIILYFLEYIVIYTFFVLIWFVIFTIFVMLLAKGLDFSVVLTISTITIIVIRITAYFKEGLSKEIAKLLPFTMLVVAITEKQFFNFSEIFARAGELPLFFENILVYIAIIIIIEIILRTFDIIFSLFRENDEDDGEDDEKDEEDEDKKWKKEKLKVPRRED